MEVIKKVEERQGFNKWLSSTYPHTVVLFYESYSDHDGGMPDTAKLAIIQEYLREEKEIEIDIEWSHREGYFTQVFWRKELEYQETFSTYKSTLREAIEQALNILEDDNN